MKHKYTVNWSKAYYCNGVCEVEADSPEEAERLVDEKIGGLEGTMQYHPDDNLIEVQEAELY